jgi:glycosyltransferase involved in cell wall biosynthesis
MRIAVCHPRTPFSRGDAASHAARLVLALRQAGHEAEVVLMAGTWYPGSALLHQMGVWRSLDLSESNGLTIDAVIPLTFPAYLVPHERKIVWLIHEHRTVRERWGDRAAGPARRDEAAMVHDAIRAADRSALDEAERVFVNSTNVQRRLWDSLHVVAESLYHRSPLTESLLALGPGPYGDVVVAPGRLDGSRRQALAIDAMRSVRSDVGLVLAGRGPCEDDLRSRIEDQGLRERVAIEVDPTRDRLHELLSTALAVYHGPFDEDFAYGMLEGFAVRRPVVTLSDSGGALEFVLDGRTGLVVEPEPGEIADAFDRLFEDRALAARLGVTGRAFLEEIPSWTEVIVRLLD